MKKNKKILGAVNEELAALYLENKGYKIIDRNYKKKSGEIDIIAKDGEYLVFCEVKFRQENDETGAYFAISPQKQYQIAKLANFYIAEKGLNPEGFYRFDCVLIDEDEINHIENAWQI